MQRAQRQTRWRVNELDVAAISRSRQQLAEGKVKDIETAFAAIRAELLALKAKKDAAR